MAAAPPVVESVTELDGVTTVDAVEADAAVTTVLDDDEATDVVTTAAATFC